MGFVPPKKICLGGPVVEHGFTYTRPYTRIHKSCTVGRGCTIAVFDIMELGTASLLVNTSSCEWPQEVIK